MRFLLAPVLTGLSIYVLPRLLPGIKVESLKAALRFGLALFVVNLIINPIVSFFALPLVWLTLGLFRVVINGLMLDLTGDLVGGVQCDSFVTAMKASLGVSVLATVAEWLLLG